MKKLLATMCLVAACMLVGCGGNEDEKVITGNNSEQGSEKHPTTEKGYVFKSGSATVVIDAEAAPIFKALGKETSYYESPSCAFGDLDKIYTYPGFEVDTYSLEGKDYISAVIFLDDSVKTVEGICIGDSVDKVKSTYGTPASESATMVTYEKDQSKLCFIIKDGVVAAVEYRTMILG